MLLRRHKEHREGKKTKKEEVTPKKETVKKAPTKRVSKK